MATANEVLLKIQDISRLYSDKRPLLHIENIIGQLRISGKDVHPLLEELADRGLIKFHQSTHDLFMLTDEGKKFISEEK
jgi:predicted transcriptional regulator